MLRPISQPAPPRHVRAQPSYAWEGIEVMVGSKLSIGTRLGAGFAMIAALAFGASALGLMQLNGIGAQFTRIVEVNNPKGDKAHEMLNEIGLIGSQVRMVALLSLASAIDAEIKIMNSAIERYQQAENAVAASIAADPTATEAERELIKKIQAAAREVMPLIKEAAAQGADGASVEASMTLMQRVRPVESRLRQSTTELVQLEARYSRESLEESVRSRVRAAWVLACLALATLPISGLLAWRLTRGVTRPVHHAIALAERVSGGDLSQGAVAQYPGEFGRLMTSLQGMQSSLAVMVSQVRESSNSIDVASSEIASGNLDLSQRTEHAASSLQQTASSMEQLTSTVNQSATAAQTANKLAATATEVATRGGRVVTEVVSTMEGINTSSKKIADIIGVIDGIAFQTNILALNAAVEAARAGEQGRGFAVVASEVRSLAVRSADAAKEIKTLIGDSVDKVASGSRLVQDAGATMHEIVASVQRVTDVIQGITSAASAQRNDIGQVNGAVRELDEVTQQNAALVEQSAAAAQSLQTQVQRLAELMRGFRLEARAAAAA